MKKLIRFPLPIDGTKVYTVEDLREHFNTEILDLHQSGLLLRWLESQRQTDLIKKVKAIKPDASDQERLDALCRVFSIELDADILQQLAQYHTEGKKQEGIKIEPTKLELEAFHEKYLDFVDKQKRLMSFANDFSKSAESFDINISFLELVFYLETGRKIKMNCHLITEYGRSVEGLECTEVINCDNRVETTKIYIPLYSGMGHIRGKKECVINGKIFKISQAYFKYLGGSVPHGCREIYYYSEVE